MDEKAPADQIGKKRKEKVRDEPRFSRHLCIGYVVCQKNGMGAEDVITNHFASNCLPTDVPDLHCYVCATFEAKKGCLASIVGE